MNLSVQVNNFVMDCKALYCITTFFFSVVYVAFFEFGHEMKNLHFSRVLEESRWHVIFMFYEKLTYPIDYKYPTFKVSNGLAGRVGG